VQPHLVAGDGDGDGDRQHPVDLRIVEHILEAIGAVGHRGNAGAHLAFGIIEQRLAGGEHHRGSVLAAQHLETLHADPVRGHLCPQIRKTLARHYGSSANRIKHVLLRFAGLIGPDGGMREAFLIDMGLSAVGEIE
jgi:hypothetical protein